MSDTSPATNGELSLQNLDEIVKPLANPTRQKLLILLAEGPITYTEILERLEIESGSFYWHIKKMEWLIEQDNLKAYQLSDLGRRAYDLLVYDGTQARDQPFRPEWYTKIYQLSHRIYQLPSWILIQQLVLIIAISTYLLGSQQIMQLGTLPLVGTDGEWISSLLSILGSLIVLTGSVIVMQLLYIYPDQSYLKKSLLPLILRVLLASSIILLPAVGLSLLLVTISVPVANSVIIQFLLVVFALAGTIMMTTAFIDQFLDLGLKDALLIVLPPYYILVLVSFFLQSF